LGEKIAHDVQSELERNGITVRNSVKASEALGDTAVEGVRLSDGETQACDLVGLGLGLVMPMNPFGDLRGERGLLADAYLQAKHEDVWVAGDCAEFDDEVTGLRRLVGNWTNAVAQGRHVGQALTGKREKFTMLTNYSTAAFPGVQLLFMGESKMLTGIQRFERELGPARRMEFRVKEGRVIGAVLFNAPDQRALCAKLITSGISLKGQEEHLSDPAFSLEYL
jgi:NAD(P)H-nitrite reductase large subunit